MSYSIVSEERVSRLTRASSWFFSESSMTGSDIVHVKDTVQRDEVSLSLGNIEAGTGTESW